MRGGRTACEAAGVSPASVSSSTSGGASMQVMFMASALLSATRLTTNSPVSRIFAAVSLKRSEPAKSPIATVGGSCPITLKKLNGAALITPLAEIVVTQAIGRGVTVAVRIL